MGGDGRGHRLHQVVDVVEAGVDDGLAQRLEPPDVQRDVVVHQEDRPRPVLAGIAEVGQDAVEGEGVEVAPAHLDDRAEAAIERAAARGFHHVDRPAEKLVALKDAGASIRWPDLAVGQTVDRTIRVVVEGAAHPVREPGDAVESAASLERPHQLAEGQLALAAHDEVDRRRAVGVGLGGEARIVAADGDPHVGAERAQELDDAQRRLPLKGHDRQADQIGLVIADEPLEGRAHLALHEHEVGDGDAMMRIDVAGQRAEGAVRHADADRGHVLERVRHRHEEDVHCAPPG